MTATDRTATYNGKTYRLLFLGDTKYGNRAKLAFTDSGKEFWVNANLVTETKGAARSASYAPAARRTRRSEDDRCEVCDGNKWTCGHCVGW